MFSVEAGKASFFDRQKVKSAADRAHLRVMSKTGAFVRTAARSSLRYGKGRSAAGKPPVVHRNLTRSKRNKKGVVKVQQVSPLRDFIFFAYDAASRSVVVGPALLNGTVGGAKALSALERGGESELVQMVRGRPVKRTITIGARPFMQPALEQEAKQLPGRWANAVR